MSSSSSQQRSIPTVDRISALPDSIICHILSFLSTKQSAATSILSKRWKPIWLSVLTLDFDRNEFTDFNTFRLFIYSVMLTRHPTFPIRSFRLKCSVDRQVHINCVERRQKAIIKNREAAQRAAVEQGIQNLILDLFGPFQINTVSTIFISINFVILKLNSIKLNVLPQIDFPLLKTLHLELVSFQTQNDLNRLFEACPILEELQLTPVAWRGNDGGEFQCLPLPNLARANITTFRDLNISFDWICNAKFLRLELNNGQQVRTFHNLTQLELIFASNWCTKWKWLLEMLQNCQKLQNLILHNKLYEQRICEEDNWNEPQIIPICISSQLRTCLLRDYNGTKCELQFAEYVLKNANLLRTMTISASRRILKSKHHQMLMDLSLCPRGSTTCKLSFI